MTQEEKAKRYEQTLERAREAKQNTESAVTIGILEEIFPELCESEDGEMKKELIKFHVIDEGKDEMDYCFTKMMNGEKVTPTWSEEDEENFRDIIGAIHAVAYQTTEDEEARIEWIKSLKQRIIG